MSIRSALEQVGVIASNNAVVGGLITFSQEFESLYNTTIWMFRLAGFLLVVLAVNDLMSLKRPNSRATTKGIALQMIFGGLAVQLTAWMDAATKSFFGDANPAVPYAYSAMAGTSQQSNPLIAALLVVLGFITLVGWIYGGRSTWILARAGHQQDVEGAVWKGIWTFIGATVLVNIALVAADLVESFGGSRNLINAGAF